MGGATRGGTAEPTSRDQNKRQEQGQGKENERSNKEEKIPGAQTEAPRQQSGAFYDSAKGGVQLTSSRVRLGQSFKTVGYGSASCWGDLGAGSVEADVFYIPFIVSVQYIGY